MTSIPKYLVLVDGALHGYWSKALLLCDLTQGNYTAVYELVEGLAVTYVPWQNVIPHTIEKE